MEIQINGERKNLADDSWNISKLLVVENVKDPEMVSVQLNGEFVTRDKFTATVLKPDDQVDFLYFMGGGQ